MLDSQDDYQILFEGAPDLLYTQELTGQITRVNRTFERVAGVSRLDVTGTSIYDLIAPEYREVLRQRILERVGGAAALPFEVELITPFGPVPVEFSIELTFQHGIPSGVQGFGRDIREKLKARHYKSAADTMLLRQTEQLSTFSRYLKLLHRLSTTSYQQLDDLFTDYLATGCEIFELECGAITEITPNGLVTRKSCEGGRPYMVDLAARRVLDAADTVVDLRTGSQTESSFYVASPLNVSDELFGVLAFWSEKGGEKHPQAREIIEMMARGMESAMHQRRLTDKLEYRARHDSLTGLPNRLMMAEELDRALAEAARTGALVGVSFIDLDRFKQINDSHGHAAGDEALREVAMRLEEATGPGCILGRAGGDEFTAVIRGIEHPPEALYVVERLLHSLSNGFVLQCCGISLTASAGVSLFPADGAGSDALLRKADAAMYVAKQKGGNRVESAVTAE